MRLQLSQETIQLNTMVLPGEMGQLRHGLSGYGWVRSRRQERYYLFCSRRGEFRGETVRLALLFAFAALLLLPGLRQGRISEIPLILNIMLWIGGTVYWLKYRQMIVSQPKSPIAILDCRRRTLTVRNPHRLPFVQIPGQSWTVAFEEIGQIRLDSAYRIRNGNEITLNPFGQYPSWKSLSICAADGKKAPRLLFVGMRIPSRISSVLSEQLAVPIKRKYDFSR